MSEPVLELINWKTGHYPGFKCGPLNLSIQPGRIVALVGANGAGKTTLLNSLIGLLPYRKGVCKFFGKARHRDEKDVTWKQEVGFVADDPLLFSDQDLESNINLISGYYPKWNDATFDDMYQHCPLPMETEVGKASKGQRMAFALMLALSWHPKILILDEPTAGLDPARRAFFLDKFMERASGPDETTVLISTHILGDVARIADEICIMNEGQILLHRDRESIVDGWYQLSLEHSSSLGQDWAEIVQHRRDGHTQLLITRDYETTRQRLSELRVSIMAARPLGLEDAVRYLLEKR